MRSTYYSLFVEDCRIGGWAHPITKTSRWTEARLHRVQEEKEQATEILKKEKEEVLEQLWVVQSCVTAYEKEKDEIRAMFEEDKAMMQKEKD